MPYISESIYMHHKTDMQYTYILLYTFFNSQGLLQEIRPLPKNAVKFKGDFKKCSKDSCQHQYCTYAHSEMELQAWNKQKNEILKCKLQ